MISITNGLIKRNLYNTLLSMYSKDYFEKYAQLTLGIFGYVAEDFKLADKPDLQDSTNSIGIEVVNIETTEEGIFRHLWNQYSGKGLSSDEFKNKLKNPKFQQKIITGVPFRAAEIRSGEARKLIDEVIQTIQRKSQKFINYKKFKQNGLYLFANHIFEEQIPELYERIQQNNFPFDFYILNLMNQLVLFMNGDIKKYELTEKQRQVFRAQSISYEQNNSCS